MTPKRQKAVLDFILGIVRSKWDVFYSTEIYCLSFAKSASNTFPGMHYVQRLGNMFGGSDQMNSVSGKITVAKIPGVYPGLAGCPAFCGVSSGLWVIHSFLRLLASVSLSLFQMTNLSFRVTKYAGHPA